MSRWLEWEKVIFIFFVITMVLTSLVAQSQLASYEESGTLARASLPWSMYKPITQQDWNCLAPFSIILIEESLLPESLMMALEWTVSFLQSDTLQPHLLEKALRWASNTSCTTPLCEGIKLFVTAFVEIDEDPLEFRDFFEDEFTMRIKKIYKMDKDCEMLPYLWLLKSTALVKIANMSGDVSPLKPALATLANIYRYRRSHPNAVPFKDELFLMTYHSMVLYVWSEMVNAHVWERAPVLDTMVEESIKEVERLTKKPRYRWTKFHEIKELWTKYKRKELR